MLIIHDKFNQQQQIKELMKEAIEILEVYLLKTVMVFNKLNLHIKDNNHLIKDNNQN